MIKNITKLEYELANRVYHFLCDQESPIPDVKEVLVQMLKHIVQIEDALKAQAEAKAAEEKAAEPKPDDQPPEVVD